MGLLCHYLKKNIIILKSNDKWNALEEMVKVIFDEKDIREDILHALIERGKLLSSGIGRGFAIPHVKVKGIDGIHVVFGKSLQGIEYDSLDRSLVYLIFIGCWTRTRMEQDCKDTRESQSGFQKFFFAQYL